MSYRYTWDEANRLREARERLARVMDHSPLSVFIGYDPREAVAYHVLVQSLIETSSRPLAITPIRRSTLSEYARPSNGTEATEFSFTRFLVPHLCNFRGLALFMDCDMLVTSDIAEVFATAEADPSKAVWCCQHDYTPSVATKFLGNSQKAYPRKNWSSFLLFRNDKCQVLTPAYVNTASAADLHRLAWVSDDVIGALPLTWNYLVGEPNQPTEAPKNIHWTIGGPWFDDYAGADHAALWFRMKNKAGL